MDDHLKTNFTRDYKPGSDAVVALINGQFADVVNGKYFPRESSLLIRGDQILAGPKTSDDHNEIKPDFYVDLKGKPVIPGLFNTHCHVQMLMPSLVPSLKDTRIARKNRRRQLDKNMADCLAHGVTNIRDTMSEDLRRNRRLKKRIANRELPGPRILQSVIVTQPNGYLSQKYNLPIRLIRSVMGMPTLDFENKESGILIFPPDADEQQVRDTVDRAIDERGAQAIKVPEQRLNLNNMKNDLSIMAIHQLEALADQAQKRGLQSTIHHVTTETFQRGVTGGVSSLGHLPCDKELTDEDVTAFITAGTIIEPTLSVGYDVAWPLKGIPAGQSPNMKLLSDYRATTFTFADLAKTFYTPELQGCVNQSHDKFTSNKPRFLGLIDMTKMIKSYCSIVSIGGNNLRKLYENGAVMATGNDGGIPPCTPAMMGLELALFDLFLNHDQQTFTGADALRTATINSACALGLQDRFGSIETGKTADLVILGADPFQNSSAIGSRADALFMDGRLVINNCDLEVTPASKFAPPATKSNHLL